MDLIYIAAALLLIPPAFLIVYSRPMWGLYAYLFGAAILLSPHLPIVREKLAVCDGIMLLLWIALLMGPGKKEARRPLRIQMAALAAGLAWLTAVLLAFIANLPAPWFHAMRASVEFATYAYGFLVCVTVVRMATTWDKWLHCIYAWALGVMVVASVGVMSATVYSPSWARDDFTQRMSSTLRESGQVASYCGPMIPLLVLIAAGTFAPRRMRWLALVFVGPTVLTVLGAGSRIALVIVVVGLLGLFVVRAQHRRRVALNDLAFYLIACLLVGGFAKFSYDVVVDTSERYALGQTSPYERPLRIFAEWARGEREVDDTRLDQFEQLSRNFFNHPMLGTGPANYSVHYRIHEVHNSYLATLAESGAIGFTMFIIWLYQVCRMGIRGWKLAPTPTRQLIVLTFLYGFGLLLLYQMTTLGLRQRPLWFACGLVIALPRVVVSAGRPGRARGGLWRSPDSPDRTIGEDPGAAAGEPLPPPWNGASQVR